MDYLLFFLMALLGSLVGRLITRYLWEKGDKQDDTD